MNANPRGVQGLAIQDVSVRYGPVTAVHSVSFDVRPGRVVGLVGTNGAGKSSLLRAISGLTPFASGDCQFDGKPLGRLPAHRRALMGMAHVPEGRGLFSRLSVMDNLRAGAPQASAALIRRRFDEVATIFPRLAERRDQTAGSLSGGEQQMVAIARALMSEPKLIMLDEPALGLAPVMVDQVAATIERLASAGKAILLAEQHVDLAVRCADELHVLVLGRVERSIAVNDDASDGVDHRSQLVNLILGAQSATEEHH
ncbi:ABC transporter ATP-binding protein [Variovorax paradoxus]|nr:ABC transporter ATP-binding protein [Variovorax paradoxus]